jgi:HEAT repeat protein
MSFLSEIYYFFLAQETRFQVAIVLVLIMLVLAGVLALVVLRERSRKNRREEREQDIRRKVEPILQEVAFSEQESEEFKDAAKRINKLVQSRYYPQSNKNILNELILYYHRNLGGEAAKRLQELYRQTGLKRNQLDHLKNGDWHFKAKAISDLSNMRMAETLYEILAYTDHDNLNVRNEAQYAAVKLGGKKALKFLDELKSPLSDWQQIRLLDQSLRQDYQLIEEVDTWLKSENESVVKFALRLVRNLNQYQEIDQIIKLLYHKSTGVQLQAVKTCEELSATKSLENLHEIYELTKDVKLKTQILRALGELGGPKEAGFLREVIITEKHYDISFEAARSLKRMGRQDMLQATNGNLTPQNQGIVKHVLDERI